MEMPPLPDYRDTWQRSLTVYRRRIAEHFDYLRVRAALELGTAVDAVGRSELASRRAA